LFSPLAGEPPFKAIMQMRFLQVAGSDVFSPLRLQREGKALRPRPFKVPIQMELELSFSAARSALTATKALRH